MPGVKLDQMLAAAARHQTAGRLDKAEQLYREVLERSPNQPDALHLLGVLALQARDVDRAVDLIGAAAGARPDDPPTLNSLGLAYRHQDRLDDAEACFARVLARQPDNPEAHNNLGDLLAARGQFGPALEHVRRAVELSPDMHQAHFNLGNLLARGGDAAGAMACYDRAEELAPDDWQVKSNKGLLFKGLGQAARARTCLEQALLLDPGNPALTLNLASALLDLRQYDEAERLSRQAAALLPKHPWPHNNLALALLGEGKQAEAVLALLHAMSLDRDDPNTQANLAAALRLEGKVEQAVGCYDRALAHEADLPTVRRDRATARLLLGQSDRDAWRDLSAHRGPPDHAPDDGRPPRWDGSDLSGETVAVLADGGLSQALLLARFLPALRDRGARVALESAPAVHRLWQRSELTDVLFDPSRPPADADLVAHLDELPLHLMDGTPPEPPYLPADHPPTGSWADIVDQHRDDGMRVGVLWRADGRSGEPHRDVPLDALTELFSVENTRWFSLQYESDDHERELLERHRVVDLAPHLADVADAAACVHRLDLLITPQNPIAHLAGAAGLRAWVLLPNAPHWCFGLSGDRTPWYPTVTLFRRPSYGPWTDLLARARAELARRARGGKGDR